LQNRKEDCCLELGIPAVPENSSNISPGMRYIMDTYYFMPSSERHYQVALFATVQRRQGIYKQHDVWLVEHRLGRSTTLLPTVSLSEDYREAMVITIDQKRMGGI